MAMTTTTHGRACCNTAQVSQAPSEQQQLWNWPDLAYLAAGSCPGGGLARAKTP